MDEDRGAVQFTAEFARQHMVADGIPTADGGMLIPHGESIRMHKEPPLDPKLRERVKEAVTFVEPASFIEYVNLYKTASAVAMASLDRNGIVGRLDYHNPTDGNAPSPDYNQHTASLSCPFDPDYARWRQQFGQQLGQVDYAEFIEDMMHTIGAPPAAELLDAITELKIHRDVKFSNKVDQRGASIKLNYEENDTQAGSVTLPQEIIIVCPIFQGTAPVKLTAKLRYRMTKEAGVRFIIVVPGLARIERDEFRKIGDQVRQETQIPLFYTA